MDYLPVTLVVVGGWMKPKDPELLGGIQRGTFFPDGKREVIRPSPSQTAADISNVLGNTAVQELHANPNPSIFIYYPAALLSFSFLLILVFG